VTGPDTPHGIHSGDNFVGGTLRHRIFRARQLAGRLLLTAALGLIRGYQRWISPGLAPRCRFYPSCSTYAVQALASHGVGRGGVLAMRRLLHCHPWNPGGLDPVPQPRVTPAQDASPLIAASPPTPPGA
jgi:putative membrane protein insertion efficiency factor